VVIQSYLRRSDGDIDRLIVDHTRVRLCKGAYDEPASVAFPSKAEVDRSYTELAERLLVGGRYPAMATHDDAIVDHIIKFARANDIGPDRFEFQMLYGVRRDLQTSLVAEGYGVRVYIPFGGQWFPYFMRRLGERPANVAFVVRSLLRES
jgi:proline dehydrogenase